jgi:arylsulfatase A-like enzyme
MSESKSRPNIILITTDQQRYDSIGINGSSFMDTPNLDRIGREGAVFRRAYCPNTVCTPSRVSMMTGLYLSRHGAYNVGTYAPGYDLFLSERLRQSGYRTHHVGKAHWHPWDVESPERRPVDEDLTPFVNFAGFDEAELINGHGHWSDRDGHYAAWVRKQGKALKQFPVRRSFEEDANDTGEWELPTELHHGSWIVNRVSEFLDKAPKEQPFFLNIGFPDPHHPHILPYDYDRRIRPEDIPPPVIDPEREQANAEHIPLFRNSTINKSRFRGSFALAGNVTPYPWEQYFADPERSAQTRAYYYSMVHLIDDQMGDILRKLDELGLTDNTMIIFASDHGEMLGDHAIGQKGPLVYEGVSHIPLLIHYPNGFAPCVVEECVSLVDLLPTVLDFAGVEDDCKRDGVSLKERLAEGAALKRSGVRIEYKEEPDRIRFKAWVTPQYKLAVYPGETFGELYDLVNDPDEFCNLYDDPVYSDVKMKLMLEMLIDMERSEPVSVRPCRV